MAKRENNYSRTNERTDFKDPQNVEGSLNHLERVGKLKQKMVLPPRHISPRCIEYYDNVIQVNSVLEKYNLDSTVCIIEDLKYDATNKEENKMYIDKIGIDISLLDNASLLEVLKAAKTDLQTRIINLSSIVIGSVIKKFPTLYPAHYEDVFTACAVDILDKINKDKYDRTKSAFHSYMYESSYQACVKYIAEKAKFENSTVQLLQD